MLILGEYVSVCQTLLFVFCVEQLFVSLTVTLLAYVPDCGTN